MIDPDTTLIVKVGYARTSSLSQIGGLESQVEKLKEYGCEKIFKEQVSGTSTDGRDQLRECLNFVREKDEVVFVRVDRIARSSLDLQLIVKELKDKGVDITATDQPISTKDATSKCFLDMLGVFAELENSIRAERQASGIIRAKALGKYKGGKSKIDVEQVKKLKEEGLGATAIARQMNIHRDSVYRLLKKVEG